MTVYFVPRHPGDLLIGSLPVNPPRTALFAYGIHDRRVQ